MTNRKHGGLGRSKKRASVCAAVAGMGPSLDDLVGHQRSAFMRTRAPAEVVSEARRHDVVSPLRTLQNRYRLDLAIAFLELKMRNGPRLPNRNSIILHAASIDNILHRHASAAAELDRARGCARDLIRSARPARMKQRRGRRGSVRAAAPLSPNRHKRIVGTVVAPSHGLGAENAIRSIVLSGPSLWLGCPSRPRHTIGLAEILRSAAFPGSAGSGRPGVCRVSRRDARPAFLSSFRDGRVNGRHARA